MSGQCVGDGCGGLPQQLCSSRENCWWLFADGSYDATQQHRREFGAAETAAYASYLLIGAILMGCCIHMVFIRKLCVHLSIYWRWPVYVLPVEISV